MLERIQKFNAKFMKRFSNVLLEVLGFLLVLFYRMFGAAENRRLLRRRVVHQVQRIFRIGCYRIFGRIPLVKSLRIENDDDIGDLLHEVVHETDAWWQSRYKYMDPYIKFEEWMIAAIFGRNIVDVRYAGSTRETTGSLHYSETATDIDMMYIYRDFEISENPLVSDHIMVLNSHTPGYVLLKVNCSKWEIVEAYKDLARKGEFDSSLQVFSLIESFENHVITKIHKDDRCYGDSNGCYGDNHCFHGDDENHVLLLRSDYFRYMHETFNRARFTGYMTFKQQGPASKIVWNVAALPQRLMLGYLDIVFALHCKEWPTQANEWLNRARGKRGYPSKDLVKEIRAYGVDIVPKSSYTRAEPSTSIFSWFQIKDFEIEEEEFHMEWRLSFSMGEIMLVKSWSSKQKCVYRLLKTLRNDYLSQYGIPSYALKNIMFYLLEETDEEFWRLNLLCIINEFLTRLIQCCKKSECLHYFIKTNNLFSSLDAEKLKMAAQKCRELQKNWYLSILLSDGLWFEIKVRGYSSRFYDLATKSCLLSQQISCSQSHFENNLQSRSCLKPQLVPCPQSQLRSYSGSHLENDLQSRFANNEILQYYDCTFKMYYCFKVQKEAMRYIRNSYISPNYSPKVVICAISDYLEQLGELSDITLPEKILTAQIAWSLIKCLRYHMKRKSKKAYGSNGVSGDVPVYLENEKEITQRIDEIFRQYILPDESCASIVAAEYFLQQRFKESLDQLESVPAKSALEELRSINQSPVLFNSLDELHIGSAQQKFDFKSSAFFYPTCLLKATILNVLNLRDRNDEFKELLEQTSKLWRLFPDHIKNVHRYKTIIMPLAKAIHDELSNK